MNPTELLKRYVAMRNAQKDYFRDRTKGNLERSKAMEQSLDRDVKAYLSSIGEGVPTTPKAPDLFA